MDVTGAGTQIDPLELADNIIRRAQVAVEINQSPFSAAGTRLGQEAFDGAQMAGSLALVSIARDLRRIMRILDDLFGDAS